MLYSRDDEGVNVVHEEKFTQNHLQKSFMAISQYWSKAQICLQNDLKCFRRGITKFKNNILSVNFLLPASLMRSVKRSGKGLGLGLSHLESGCDPYLHEIKVRAALKLC